MHLSKDPYGDYFIVEWATQCFPGVNKRSTTEIIKVVFQPSQQTQLLPGIHCSTLLKLH
jgi:hypothetical protein